MRKILGCMRKAAQEYEMIMPGDVIGVGISGGKDSLALLYGLHLLRNFYPVPFTIKAFSIDMGYEKFDFSPVKEFCSELGIEYIIEKTNIYKIVFDVRKEKNPCALCANLRRGALYNLLKKHGVSKAALGHHRDDAIETLLLSMLYEGRIHSFMPVTHLDRQGITVIRPLVYAEEKDIIGTTRRHNFPVIKSKCPAEGTTKRDYIKVLLSDIDKENPRGRENLLKALTNPGQLSIWNPKSKIEKGIIK